MNYDSRSNSSLPQPIRNQVNMLTFSGNLMGSTQTLMTPSQTELLSFASDSKLVIDRTRNASRKRPYPTLVAGLAGSKDRRISHQWAKEDGPEPHQAAVRRPMAAIRLWTELSEAGGEHVARWWFIGSNSWLDEGSPVEAIMEDRCKEARAAAHVMLTGGF